MHFQVENKIKQQILNIASSILSRNMNIIEGCRLITSLRFSLSENKTLHENEVFNIFRAVELEEPGPGQGQ